MFNKFNVTPTYNQQLQGSKKLLTYWLKYQTNYWEDLGRDDGVRDTPPRRDTIGPYNYESGELAVELVWQLASEATGTGGLPWIFYTTNLRDSKYTAATALALLLQNNWDFDEVEINKLSGYSKEDIFKYIIEDNRYQSRYFLIWKFANTVTNFPNWKEVDWFGTFNDQNFPWIFHAQLGWLFHGTNTTASMWLYSSTMKSWIWTSNKAFPWVYFSDEKDWRYINISESPVRIYSSNTKKWVLMSDL